MLLFKSLLRFSLLLILCVLLVYAPEILSSVSPPYSIAASQRTLLRIVLCCDSETATHLQKAISNYQRRFPFVHLRITQVSEDQLTQLSIPYPDIVLCPESLENRLLPSFDCSVRFAPLYGDHTMLCALSCDHTVSKAAQAFAAYIDEANLDEQPDNQI